MKSRLTFIGILFMVVVGCSAKSVVAPTAMSEPIVLHEVDSVVIEGFDFVNIEADTIIDPTGSLDRFYEQLSRLRMTNLDDGQIKVNVLHYGDSHVQGATFPDVVMKRLQRTFGNAGRGLLVPHRLTRSNEALDYKIVTPNRWATARLIDLKPEVQIGVGGVGLKSDDPQQQFILRTYAKGVDSVDYSFNRIVVFHDSLAPMISVREDLLADISISDTYYDFTTEIDLTESTDSIMLYTFAQDKFRDGAFYGFSVENGRNGVLYHTIGVNGACYLHWGRQGEVVRESKALHPDLIIVSLGSNEAAGYNFIEDVFYNEIDRFVSAVRAENPKAAILLTTPAEAMRVRKRAVAPNPNFEKIERTIMRYGRDKGVAVFNLYAATGGSGSAKEWVSNKLMQRDKIHYTSEGYKIQGLLLYGALINGYKKHNLTK